MEAFTYRNGRLYAEDIPLSEIARQFGTPCYVYSGKAIEEAWRDFAQAFGHYPHLICYAVKANSNLAILNLGDGTGLATWGRLFWRGRLAFRVKDRIDRRFLEGYQKGGGRVQPPG
jgi:diaminopimelate decarboxylase